MFAEIDDNISISSGYTSYSDQIDSDIEAQLYGLIHHEANTQDNIFSLLEDSPASKNDKSCDQSCSIQNSSTILVPTNNEESYIIPLDGYSSQKSENNSKDTQRRTAPRKKRVYQNLISNEFNLSCERKSLKRSNATFDVSYESKKKICKSNTKSSQKNVTSVNNEIIIISDSDSDNLWHKSNNLDQVDLKINLMKNMEDISSDSCNSLFSSIRTNGTRNVNANMSLPNIKLGGNSSDLWHVNDEDLYRSSKNTGRYHERAEIVCTLCKQRGHPARKCSTPKIIKCYICGGDHIAAVCKDQLCGKCFCYGHTTFRCRIPDVGFCSHCSMEGHTVKDCPDNWRRYHLTTKPNKKIVRAREMDQTTPIFCCNCGRSGHFGAECKLSRMNKWCFPTWPSVITYNDPNKDFQRFSNEYHCMENGPVRNNFSQNQNWHFTEQQQVVPFQENLTKQESKKERRRANKKAKIEQNVLLGKATVREMKWLKKEKKRAKKRRQKQAKFCNYQVTQYDM